MGMAKSPMEILLNRTFTPREQEEMLREDMEAELDAINLYSQQLSITAYDDVKKALEEIIYDEKTHFEIFRELLEKHGTDEEKARKAAKRELAKILKKNASSHDDQSEE